MRWKPLTGRIRNHLRKPIPKRCELLKENTRNTVSEIVPDVDPAAIIPSVEK